MKICWPEMTVHAYTWHFFGYSQEIITKKSSFPSRLILRRHMIRVYSVCSQKFLSEIFKKNELLHPMPHKMKMDCGWSRVRFSGWATFFHGDLQSFCMSNSRRKNGLCELTRNLAEFSPQKFAFENFCSSSEREKKIFSWADLYIQTALIVLQFIVLVCWMFNWS